MVTTTSSHSNNCWKTVKLLWHRLLLATFCFSSTTTVVGAPTNGSEPIIYTCTFPGASIPCFGDQDYYACCYEPYGDVMYKCGLDCYGEITYQRPTNVPSNIRTTNPYEKTTSWNKVGVSNGVELTVVLLISIPAGLVGVAFIALGAVGIMWCRTLYKRSKQEPQSSGIELRNDVRNDNIENALNESRQDVQLHDAPPDYHTAVNEQASPFLDGRTVSQSSLPPPSYAKVT